MEHEVIYQLHGNALRVLLIDDMNIHMVLVNVYYS